MGDDSDNVSKTDVTKEEIKNYEQEHGEPHPVFEVSHQPKRKAFTSFGGEDTED